MYHKSFNLMEGLFPALMVSRPYQYLDIWARHPIFQSGRTLDLCPKRAQDPKMHDCGAGKLRLCHHPEFVYLVRNVPCDSCMLGWMKVSQRKLDVDFDSKDFDDGLFGRTRPRADLRREEQLFVRKIFPMDVTV